MIDENIAAAVRQHGGQKPAARALGISHGKVQRALRRLRAVDGKHAQKLADENRALRRKIRELTRAELTQDRIRQEAFGLAAARPSIPKWVRSGRRGGSAPGIPVTNWSDFHWGETVSKAETYGLNEYSPDIARKRFRRLVDRTIDLCFEHMVQPEYPGAVICLGGDMISGSIHQELAEANDGTVAQQISDVFEPLAWGIATMADHFGRVLVVGVAGNHGREWLKPRFKRAQVGSFDWLLYVMLEREFRNDPRVRFVIPNGPDAAFKVYDHRFFLTHGDRLGVRGGDGIIGALGPIMRGRVKLANSEAQIGRDFDTLMICHWHQHIALPGLRVNGSLKGYDEFARLALRAPYQRPTQDLFFVHRQHGITATWPVYCDDAPRAAEGPLWVSWRAA